MPGRYRIGRIPRKYFSKKYRMLPLKKRIAIRLKMKHRILRILGDVDKTAERAEKFNERLANILASLHAGKKVKVNLAKEKRVKHRLLEKRKELGQAIGEFEKFAEPWFESFHPEVSQLERFIFNPVETAVHTARTGVGPVGRISSFLNSASKHLEIIERELGNRTAPSRFH